MGRDLNEPSLFCLLLTRKKKRILIQDETYEDRWSASRRKKKLALSLTLFAIDGIESPRRRWLLFHVGIVMIDDEREKKRKKERWFLPNGNTTTTGMKHTELFDAYIPFTNLSLFLPLSLLFLSFSISSSMLDFSRWRRKKENRGRKNREASSDTPTYNIVMWWCPIVQRNMRREGNGGDGVSLKKLDGERER